MQNSLADAEFLFSHTQSKIHTYLVFSILQNLSEEQKCIRGTDWGLHFCKETHKICKKELFLEFLEYLHFVAW